MDTVLYHVRSAIEYGLAPFDALSPLWGLTVLSILTGGIMLWVVGRTTPQRRIEVARARMASAIYELRLFLDSPRRIFAAQGRLLLWSGAYTAFMVPAFLILSVPLGFLFLHLDVRYGQMPLPLNTPVAVKIAFEGQHVPDLQVENVTRGLQVTAPLLRVPDEGLAYLRVSMTEPGRHELTLRTEAGLVTKQLSAAGVPVAPERSRGVGLLWSYGHEPPLPSSSGISAVSVSHPAAPQSWLGFTMPWYVFWLVIATLVALALKRPMGVAV
jgi:hypothetical protein